MEESDPDQSYILDACMQCMVHAATITLPCVRVQVQSTLLAPLSFIGKSTGVVCLQEAPVKYQPELQEMQQLQPHMWVPT